MYPRILVPMDGSDITNRGLVEAIRLAHGHATELVLLRVIDDFPTIRVFAAGAPREVRHCAEQTEI